MAAVALLAHGSIPLGLALGAEGLFFAGTAAGIGAYMVAKGGRSRMRRASTVGLGVVAAGCLGLATALPLFGGAGSFVRPSSTARIQILSPAQGAVIRGDPATIPVVVGLQGGEIVPFTSLHVVANEGHVHLYLDGKLASMTASLSSTVTAAPGTHTLRAEFVAVDHAPFRPHVIAQVTFQVRA